MFSSFTCRCAKNFSFVFENIGGHLHFPADWFSSTNQLQSGPDLLILGLQAKCDETFLGVRGGILLNFGSLKQHFPRSGSRNFHTLVTMSKNHIWVGPRFFTKVVSLHIRAHQHD